MKSQQNYDSETPLKNQWWIATIQRYKALCSFGFSLHTQICTESSILGGWFRLKMSAFSMINVKSEREGWKRLRLPQRLSSSGLLAHFYPNISSAPLIQSVVGLVLAVGSNKLDFYFPHNGPRGPPPALRQNHCNTFLLHNHFQYSAKKLNLHFVLLFQWGRTAAAKSGKVHNTYQFIAKNQILRNT